MAVVEPKCSHTLDLEFNDWRGLKLVTNSTDLNSRDEVGEDDIGQGFELDRVLVVVVALQAGHDHPHQVQRLVLAHVVAQVQRAES